MFLRQVLTELPSQLKQQVTSAQPVELYRLVKHILEEIMPLFLVSHQEVVHLLALPRITLFVGCRLSFLLKISRRPPAQFLELLAVPLPPTTQQQIAHVLVVGPASLVIGTHKGQLGQGSQDFAAALGGLQTFAPQPGDDLLVEPVGDGTETDGLGHVGLGPGHDLVQDDAQDLFFAHLGGDALCDLGHGRTSIAFRFLTKIPMCKGILPSLQARQH